MKLVQIVKFVLSIKKTKNICFPILLVLLCIQSWGQSYKLDFKNETLANALNKVSEQYKIKVAFDAQKAAMVNINKQVTGNTPEEFMKNLLSGLPFDYMYKHNRYLIIDKVIPQSRDTLVCQLLGSITDRESGEQLPYATIVLPELNLNTYASSSGSFSFKNISKNPFQLTVNFIGYNPIDTFIHWNHQNLNCHFRLKRKVQIMDTVVVNSPKLEMIDFRKDVDFATTVNVSKLIDLPILAETDIFRTLQLLPGISYSENSAELSIHGGSSDQNLILFDGQTLYNLSHYYGVISSLNPNVIKDVQVFKGGYDSRYGERISGIVDITGKSGNLIRPKVYGDINLISGNITAEIPVNKKLSLVAAYRRSYSDIYSTEFADSLFTSNTTRFKNDSNNAVSTSTPSFRFYDYNLKLTYLLNSKENFAVSYYGGKDFFENAYSQYTHGLRVDNIDKNNWSNYGVSAGWTKQWNESYFSSLQFGASGYSNSYSNNTTIDKTSTETVFEQELPNDTNRFNVRDENTLNDISVSLKNSYTINNSHQLFFGGLIRQNSIYYHKDAGETYIYDNIDMSSWVSTVYLLDKIKLNRTLTFKPGIRASYYDGSGKLYIEPRAALGVALSPKASLRMAYGRYCQYLSQVSAQQETGYIKNFWVLSNKTTHPVLSSNHYIVGVNIRLGDFLFDVEAYYKNISGIQEYFSLSHLRKNSDFDRYFPKDVTPAPIVSTFPPSFFISGDGKAYGADFLLEYKKKSFTGWISYTLSRSYHSFDAINNGMDIPATTDQLHQLSVTDLVSLGKWNFSTITLFTTGRPYYDSRPNFYNSTVTRNYKRLSNYFRADFSANYTFSVKNARFKLGASIINFLNTENYFDVNTRDVNYETTSFTQTNLIRSTARSLNLYLHFSF